MYKAFLSRVLAKVCYRPFPLSLTPGPHGRSEAAHRGPVQRPAPVPVPGGKTPPGEAEDGGAQGADPPGRAQGPAVRGDLPPAEGRPRDRG